MDWLSGTGPYPDHVWSVRLQNIVLSKLHPTEAIALRTPKAAQSVSQIQRQKASKSEQFSASCFVKGLAAHTAPFRGLKHRPGLRLSSINCLVTQTKAYCCGTTLMACGWVQRGPLMTEKEGEWRARKGGDLSSTITTFDNDESKRRDGQLGFVEWNYLVGP